MTCVGSIRDAEREQERIQGFSPEGVEDFTAKWFSAINPFIGGMPGDDQAAQDCANAFQGLAQQMGAIGTAMSTAQQQAFERVFSAPLAPPAMAEAAAKIEAHLARSGSLLDLDAPPNHTPIGAANEIELLREQLAAERAELAAARAALAAAATQALLLTGQTAEPAQHPLKRAVAAWGGYGGIDQLTGKGDWW